MRLEHMILAAVEPWLGRLLRRALLVGLAALFFLVALYHLTNAALLALAQAYGLLTAQLIVGGAYAFATLALLGTVWAMRRGATPREAVAPLPAQQQVQIAMLVDAAMLGYSMAKRGERAD